MPIGELDRLRRRPSSRSWCPGWAVGIRMPWFPPLRHRPGDGLDINQERLVFRRLDVGIADIRRERVRTKALPRRARESPMQGDADDVHGFAIASERDNAFGYHGFCLDRSALGPDPDPASRLDALFLRQLLRNLDEEFRLQRGEIGRASC